MLAAMAGRITRARTGGGRAGARRARTIRRSSASKPSSRRKRSRQERSSERRHAILAAALDEFSQAGFAAARLDDVAKRAGVAKGTIYLYFRDKESLFQEIVREMLAPLVAIIEGMGAADVPMARVSEHIVDLFVREVYETRRKDVIRLILTEGQ